jgi:DNA-binding transcriptional ArsR family regulator
MEEAMKEIAIQRLAGFLHALGAGSRLAIVRILLDEGTLCVGALSRRLGISQSAVSQHLRILREKGLVQPERRGYHIHYRLDGGELGNRLDELLSVLGEERGADASQTAAAMEGEDMCQGGCDCGKSGKHRDGDAECSPERIRECHGEGGDNPCEHGGKTR